MTWSLGFGVRRASGGEYGGRGGMVEEDWDGGVCGCVSKE